MNIIQKRKGQLKGLGVALLVLGVLALIGGILMSVLCAPSIALIIVGAIIAIAGVAAAVVGLVFTWTASAVKATNGSIAEDNLAIGTANMHKCTNCGAAIPEDKTICDKCEENLKP